MKHVLLFLVLTANVFGDDLSDAFDALKRAEAARNAADVRKYAVETSRLARIEIARQPPAEVRNDYQKDRAIYLSQTDTYTEYSMAVAAGWPGVPAGAVIDLTETVMVQNPKSDYLALAVPPYFAALGPVEEQLRGAKKVLALQPDNEDAWLATADGNLRAQQFGEASKAAAELLAVISAKPRPDRYSPETWAQKKAALTLSAHFTAGVAACSREAWEECDAHLRPYSGAGEMAGPVNFYLGWANYQLGKTDRTRLQEALKFSQVAAGISGLTQEAAAKNAAAIQQELTAKPAR